MTTPEQTDGWPSEEAVARAARAAFKEAHSLSAPDEELTAWEDGPAREKEIVLRVMRAALLAAAPPTSGWRSPEGWVLAPMEATDAMELAGSFAWVGGPDKPQPTRFKKPCARTYRAMIAAAPTPPSEEER